MKRLILLVIFILTLSVNYSSFAAFNLQFNTAKVTSCLVKKDVVYYVANQTYSKTMLDEFSSTSGDKYISDSRTSIFIWRADNALLSNCTDVSAWKKTSDIVPNNMSVVALSANCTFNKPTNKNNRNVQFVYNIWYSKITSGGTQPWTANYATRADFENYTYKSKTYQNYKSEAEGIHGNECFNVELRYCGDGILEPGNGETCDPEDASKTGWGNGGCNTNTCQPINNPVCKQLTVTPPAGTNPLDVTATCTGYKVGTFKIDCGNGQVFTGNGANSGEQTFSKVCNYTTGDKTFTPTCYINDTITSPSCTKPVSITNPIPSILVDKKDANVFDLDKNVGNDTQTVYKGSGATFEITVRNNGAEALKNITLSDPQEASCGTKAGTIVDLSAQKFTNGVGANVTISFAGAGAHTNDQLEVGETFTYTCKTSNLSSAMTNTVGVNGVGLISGKVVTDTDPTVVIVVERPIPQISVEKRDDNAADLDGNKGWNDSQTVTIGSGAVFRITVENTGTENLKNVTLTDAQAIACGTKAGSYVDFIAKTFKNGNDAVVNIAVSGNGNHTDGVFQPGEIFTYACSKANTQTAYTNIVDVWGVGVTSGTSVSDTDPTEVLLSTTPAIQIIKEDANSNDLDGVQHNDTQTVVQGSSAVFYIRVVNTGNEALKDLKLTDVLAPACATLTGTTVNLQGGKFVNTAGVNVLITHDGAGNHTDNIFQVGEEFTYTCEKGNTQSNYTNTVAVSGIGVTSGKPVNDNDTSPVIVNTPIYDLALKKVLSASNGTGSLQKGGMVSFDIQVFNQGNVDANNIEVTDYIPTGLILNDANWTQSGAIAKRSITKIKAGESVIITIRFTIAVNAPNSITNYAEISWDDGNDCDSTPDTNVGNDGTVTDNATGSGCEPGGDEDDHDPATIVLGTDIYDLALVKRLSTTTQGPFSSGSTVVFDIEVYNQGNVLANNIEVTDYIPTGLILNDSTWTQSGSMAKQTIWVISAGEKKTLTIQFKIAANPPASITNLAEISRDDGNDCDSTPDTNAGNDGTITDNATGTACEPGGDEDDHDPATITTTSTPTTDVYLIKSLAAGQSTVVNPGDRVHYVITVVNSGSTVANNYTVEDHFPAGLILDDANWTLVAGQTRVARYNTIINNLAVGAQVQFDIYFKIASDVTGPVRNLAVVCKIAPGQLVCDPKPPVSCDDATEIGTPEGCVEVTVPSCLNLTATPSSAENSLTSNLVCTGTGATTYKIEVKNAAGTIVNTFNSSTASVTLGTVGTYTASCYINNKTTTQSVCEKTLSVTTSSSSSSSSSGGVPTCQSATQSGSTVKCIGNSKVDSFYLKCGNTIKWPKNASSDGGARYANFDCSDDAYQCYVYDKPNSIIEGNTWRTSSTCVNEGGSNSSSGGGCGNGILQISKGEQCDMGSAKNGKIDANGKPYACDAQCKLRCTGDDATCISTIPNGGDLVFGPKGSMILGHNKNPLVEKNETPYIKNNSDYDIAIDQLCVTTSVSGIPTLKNPADVVSGERCVSIPARKIFAWSTIDFQTLGVNPTIPANFITDKAKISTGKDFGTENVVTSMKLNGTSYQGAYFAGKLEVRVAKPAVTTLGGGTSYVKSTTTSDLKKVTSGVTGYENNSNFVGTSVSSGSTTVSSYTTASNNTAAVTKAQNTASGYTQAVVKTITGSTLAAATQTVDKFTQTLNGLSNVYIVKDKNVKLSSFTGPTEATTYIIENGNLVIDTDISVSKNIAFVVKGGNIIIETDVTKLDGTYIAIPVNGVGGKIESEGTQGTDKQLVFKGSVYGDMTDLVNDRYYISSQDNGQLSVGTIVSFGSSIFHKPAPLVGQFVGEYLDTTKVAK